jgi:hypothetical protein
LFLDEVGDIPVEITTKTAAGLAGTPNLKDWAAIEPRGGCAPWWQPPIATWKKMMENREFRSELHYRLNVFRSAYHPAGTPGRYSAPGPLLHPKEVWTPDEQEDRIGSHPGHEEALELALAGEHS